MKARKLHWKSVINLLIKIKSILSETSSNYFTQHWTGEHRLIISFWINYITVGVFLLLFLRIYPEELETSTLHALYIYITIYCIALIILIWQMVGVWRSADNHIQKSRRKFWPFTAKMFVILGLVSTCFMLKDLLPGLNKFIYIFSKDIDVPKYSFRIMANKKEIEITGGIHFGLTESLRKTLHKYPTIKVIHLNSPGGRVTEAKLLREFIAEKKLITSTNKGCLSACTIAYMGGVSRFVYGNKKLGFHRYALADKKTDFIKKAVFESFQEDKSFFVVKGASVNFMNHIYNTPSSDLWLPENDVLLANKIITDIAGKETFLLYQEKTSSIYDDIKKISNDASAYPAIKL